MSTSYEQRAMRLLTALHEATHFVAMIEERDPIMSVMVAPKPVGRRTNSGGMVCGLNNGGYENEWFTTLVGSTVEYVLLNPPGYDHLSPAFFHDFERAVAECRNWYKNEVEMGRLEGPAEMYVVSAFDGGRVGSRARNYIVKRWMLIDLCATAFLIYGNRKGEVSREVIAALKDAVTKRLTSPWPKQHRSASPAALRNSLPSDVLSVWQKHSPHIDPDEWLDVA
jgi:hypothetical protein